MQLKSIIFIGRSGCGKGTQSDLLIQYFKTIGQETTYLSTGNEFRKLIAEKNNFTSIKIDKIYEEGRRPADFLCITILGNFFKENFSDKKNLIIDGGLRSLNEASTVTDILDFYEVKNPHVFYLNVSHEWSKDKLKKRGRDDDNDEIYEVKKTWFEKEVLPAIDFLENNDKFNFHTIDGEQEIQTVHKEILEYLK
jgi:adenylate kinase family enzyme